MSGFVDVVFVLNKNTMFAIFNHIFSCFMLALDMVFIAL